MDLDLRKLRYFAAVAEHRHFGRAAAQLFIAQPVLSRQVRALERELGCALLTRTTRSVALTPAGEQLYEETRGVFGTVDAAVRRVHETDRGEQRLVVAFAPGLHVSDAVRAFGATHPAVRIDLFRLNWWEPDAPLRDGRADVGYLRRPFDETGLQVIRVGSDPKVVCLPARHRLVRSRSLRLSDLDGEDVLDAQARRTSTVEEKFELIAAGDVVALMARSVARSYTRADLVHVPLADVAPTDVCVVVPEDRREPRVRDFVDVAVATFCEEPTS